MDKIREVLQNIPQIEAAYVFGSQSAGTANGESDYDLALFVKDKEKINVREILTKIGSVFPNMEKLHLSIVDLKNSSPSFLFQIVKNGKPIYCKSEIEKTNLEARVMHMFYDDEHRQNIYFSYLEQKYAN